MLNGSEKIKKILPQLTADDDMSIVVAINAIKRILAAEGKSFHDVEIVAKGGFGGGYGSGQYGGGGSGSYSGFREQAQRNNQQKRQQQQEKKYEAPKEYTFEQQKEMADFIDKESPLMNEWESEFWESMKDRIWRFKLSAKQMDIINRLYTRVKY